ncbi:DeoR/GlpR family DNA-binding transcription regulator [Bartonella sp. LJL80]
MIPAERQALIIQRLSERGVLSIAEIADILNVSQMTVRRDIRALEDQGRALSVAGGIQLPERISSEPSHLAKRALAHQQKAALGRFAASMVKPGSIVYLDAGTTILEIAHHLTTVPDLTVVTNDFVIAAFLSQESDCRLFHTGGEVERENQSCVGTSAGVGIRHFNFDLSFISTSSFGPRGISTPQENKIPVKRAVVESSSRKILVTDSSKYGRVGTFNAIPLDTLTAVITDKALPQNAQDAITQRGVELHLVDYAENSIEGS